MAKNQLIIGLGGVGGRSIAAFRKAVVTHEADYKVLKDEKGCRFEYLYIDSNHDILNSNIWEVYGRSVELGESDCVMLKDGGSTNSIKEISRQENIAPWIGELADHFAKRTGKKKRDDGSLDSELFGLDGAGQLRRYGRVLFAMHSQVIRVSLQSKIENLTHEDSEIDVRIFCTLGGGTGSGSIIDMVTLIQSLADDSGHTYHTFIYPFIAGLATDAQDTGSFYQNEYASLRDLNALMVGKYHPYIAGVVGHNVGDNYYHKKGNHPVHAIYISTEMSQSQGSINLETQIDFMAKACFDTIMYSMLYKKPECLKALSGEDLVQVTPGEPADDPLRSYRFSALGSKRWCIPTDKIKDLLKYEYELRVLNSWRKGSPLPDGVDERDIGKVSIDFNPKFGKTWEAIERYCNEVKKRLEDERKSIERNAKRGADTLRTLGKICGECVEKISKELSGSADVRLVIQRCAQEDAADMLTRLKEKMDDLFKWDGGALDTAWGIEDIRRYLERYKDGIKSWKRVLTGSMDDRDIEARQGEISDTMERREEQWEKIGFLTIHLTNKDELMIDSQFGDCIHSVDLALLPFQRRLLQILIDEALNRVTALCSRVMTAEKEIADARTDVNKWIQKLESDISSNTTNHSNVSDQFELDKENLDAFRDEIKKLDGVHAEEMANKYSPEWKRIVGSFDKYGINTVKKVLARLNQKFYDSSEILHRKARENNGTLKDVLLASIFDRLIQLAGTEPGQNYEYWDAALKDKVKKFVGDLRCSTDVDGKGKGGLTSPQQSPCKAIVFGFPKGAGAPDGFVRWLKQKLEKELPPKYRPMQNRMDFFEHNTDGEIRVLYMPYWFPARFAPVIAKIYERYRETAKRPNERVKIYFANIDEKDYGLTSETRPSLTETSRDKDNVRNVDLACKLYFKYGDQRKYAAKADDSGIIIIKGIDADGIVEYSEEYSPEERTHPSGSFKEELENAIENALEQMDRDDKASVFDQYTKELKELERRKKSEGTDPDKDAEVKEAREARKIAGEKLGLNTRIEH